MAKEHHYDPRGFVGVDQHGDPGAFVRFMDTTRQRPSVQQQKNAVLSLLQLEPGNSVLDVGCGTGDDILVMAKAVGKSGRAVGIDSSKVMISEALKRTADSDVRVELAVGSAYDLPYPDSTFDAVRCERVFEHLDKPQLALQEIVRVTKSGGRIVLASSDVDSHLFDLPNVDIVRKIVHADCDRRPNGWAGRRLYCQMAQAGLLGLSASGFVHCSGDYERANHVFEFDQDGKRALDAGQIAPQEAAAWATLLTDAKRTGTFFFSTTQFVVAGRKP